MTVSTGGFGLPGQGDIIETTESEVAWGVHGNVHAPLVWRGVKLASATVDARSSVTTQLQPGLWLADMGDGSWKHYDPASATAAQRIPAGILTLSVDMVDPYTGSAVEKYGPILVGGPVVASKLSHSDYWTRSVASKQFLFDDYLHGFKLPWKNEVAKTADYTVLTTDAGTLFTNTGAGGAVNFTLPTIARGLHYWFLATVNQNVTVTSAEGDNIVAFNDAAADSLAGSTASEKIGAFLHFFANQAGDKWYVMNHSFANTVTVAT